MSQQSEKRAKAFRAACRAALVSVASSACMILPSLSAHALQKLTIEPRSEARATLTDNVQLTEDDRIEDLVLSVSPGINIRAQGKNLEASIDYSADYFYFVDQGETDLRQNLFGLVTGRFLNRRLTLEARASIAQTFLDRTQSLSGSVANLSDNRRTVQTYTGRALYSGRLKNIADVSLSYDYTQQLTPADNLEDETLSINFSDTETHRISADVTSGDRFGRLGWRLFANSRRAFRSLDVNNFREESVGAELNYELTRQFELFGSIGATRNDLQSAVLNEEGFTWSSGFRWEPSRRTEVEASFGQVGARNIINTSIRTRPWRRVEISASYVDQLQANTFQLSNVVRGLNFSEEFGIVNREGVPADTTDPSFTLTDVDFRQRSANLVIRWDDRRETVFVTADWESRQFDDGSGTARSWGAGFNWEHRINRRHDFVLRGNFRRNLFEGGFRTDNLYTASAEYKKTFSRYFIGAISYSYTDRRSTEVGGDLRENAVTIYLRGTF